MLLVITVFAIAAVGLGAWSVSTAIEDRRVAQRSLRAVAGYSTTTIREQELTEAISDRLLTPLTDTLQRLARRFTPDGYVDSVRRKIVLGGNPAGYEVDRFLTAKVLGAGSLVVWLAVFNLVLPVGGLLQFVLVAALTAASFLAPDALLSRHITNRRDEIERQLPDVLDLLVISVEAGLGFEQALDRTATAVPGALSEEAGRMLQEIRMGASRADALRALDERTQVDDLRTFIMAMLQADSFGISIASILNAQADEIRIRRRLRAQERAQRMPVKMLFPLVFCVFPAIFVVVLLPGLLTILDALG